MTLIPTDLRYHIQSRAHARLHDELAQALGGTDSRHRDHAIDAWSTNPAPPAATALSPTVAADSHDRPATPATRPLHVPDDPMRARLLACCCGARGKSSGSDARFAANFAALLDKHFPSWREARAELNALPLSAEVWNEQVG